MLLRPTFAFIPPALPSTAERPPIGGGWWCAAMCPAEIFLYAFDLLELDGQDLRREPLESRKVTLASLLRGCGPGLRLVEHLEHGGDVVYRHACRLGCEGIVSKRLGSPYVSGRTRQWLKFKNQAREAEDWSKERWR